MRGLFNSFLGYFLTAPGLVLLAALDSSVIFFLPLGVDFGVIVLAARKPDLFWLYALLATAGSVLGAAVTFWIGRKVGEEGLARFVTPSRLERIKRRIGDGAAVSIAALGVIPPPFPFTAFVLASGAGQVNPRVFLGALAGVRAVRFVAEAALAAYHGRAVLAFMQSRTFTFVVVGLAILAVIGTIVSAVALYRSTRRSKA